MVMLYLFCHYMMNKFFMNLSILSLTFIKKKFTLSINPIKCHLFFCQFTKFLVHPIWTPCELMNYRQSVVKADVTYLFLPSHISLLGFYRYPELFLHPRRDQQPEWLDCLMRCDLPFLKQVESRRTERPQDPPVYWRLYTAAAADYTARNGADWIPIYKNSLH